MNARRRRYFAERLAEERANLTNVVAELAREAEQSVVEAAPERLKSRDAPSDAEVAAAATSLEMARLRAIDAALDRLREDPDAFGKCIVCHKPIAESRLEIVPWTQWCSKHAEEQARRSRAFIASLTGA